MSDERAEQRPLLRVGILGVALAAGLLLTSALVGGLVGRYAGKSPATAGSVVVVRPTPSLITAVRDLARLESAEYHVERVIDLSERQQRFFGLVATEDAILLVASGDVTAGIDLRELGEGDVSVDLA